MMILMSSTYMYVECASVHGKVKGADTCILEVLGLLIAMLKLTLGMKLLILAFCSVYKHNSTWVASSSGNRLGGVT